MQCFQQHLYFCQPVIGLAETGVKQCPLQVVVECGESGADFSALFVIQRSAEFREELNGPADRASALRNLAAKQVMAGTLHRIDRCLVEQVNQFYRGRGKDLSVQGRSVWVIVHGSGFISDGNREILDSAHIFDSPHLVDMFVQMTKDTIAWPHHRCRPTSNRRAEKRLFCSDLIKVRWVDRHGSRREEVVVLEGYSLSGASLFLGVPIGVGTQVTFADGAEEFGATVAHCVRVSNGYLAGVSFMDLPRSYVPEHLLDLSHLIYSEEP
jgi:hypothetical protein